MMIRRIFFVHLLDAAFAVGGVLAIGSVTPAQAMQLHLRDGLDQTNQTVEESWNLVDEVKLYPQQKTTALLGVL